MVSEPDSDDSDAHEEPCLMTYLRSREKLHSTEPEPSFGSVKSYRSMEPPLFFKDETFWQVQETGGGLRSTMESPHESPLNSYLRFMDH